MEVLIVLFAGWLLLSWGSGALVKLLQRMYRA